MADRRPTPADALHAARQFDLLGEPVYVRPHGHGHINDTFLVLCDGPRAATPYVMQRINHKVFPRPDQVMANICRVTNHLRAKIAASGGCPDRECLTVVPAGDGRPLWVSDEGLSWRTYLFIVGASTHDVLSDNRQAYEAARAFGRFQRQLSDLPGDPLHETIANFHHTPSRFSTLQAAIGADAAKRCDTCRDDIAFALAREAITPVVADALASGELPLRVTHNDTKINNVMLDDQTGEATCVIDLDTVMPGSSLYDFGDQVRTSVGHFAENERDLSKVGCDTERFACLVRGYLEAAGEVLTDRERELLAFAGILITFEIGIRFLTDYLQGDVYFKTHRPGENLDRARTQFALVRDLEAKRSQLESMVKQHS